MNQKNEPANELELCKQEVAQLKRENNELVRNLYTLNEKLRDSERLKGHFISNITNEIVNPFTSVLALSETIKQLKDGEMPQAHRMADLIFEEAFHLDFQLKNIFAAAMIEAGKSGVNYSVIRISELSDQIGAYFNKQLSKQNIRLAIRFLNGMHPDSSLSFTSDQEKLEMILKNLISNSIKFSPEGSVIELNFVLEKGILLLEVSDQGKGIDLLERSVVFDRFKQLDEKINSINTGHGLGLSIVQAYAELLGGKVSINENSEGGLRVTVSIPENGETGDWDDLEDFLMDTEASY